MDAQTLYREEILEHYRNPQNFGKPKTFDVSSKQSNPFCGDEIEIFLTFNNGKVKKKSLDVLTNSPPRWTIKKIRFFGKGCAVSMAAASMLTEQIKGKTKKELTKFSEQDMLRILGIEVSETRKKCALMALVVLRDCLK